MDQQVRDDPFADTASDGDEPGFPAVASLGGRYSASMMADVLRVPPAAVRHWIRVGLLEVAERIGSLEWLDFGQLVLGRRLAGLLASGLSLREIDAKLASLAPGSGGVATTIDRIVVDGRRLSIDRDGRLLAAGGQMQFAFYTESLGLLPDRSRREEPPVVEFVGPAPSPLASSPPDAGDGLVDVSSPGGEVVAEILDLADDLEAAGEYVEAAEALRAVLQAQGPTAGVTFTLAELLYRAGDLTAARERYYATLELAPDHLQARVSLGCVLGELGELELALAALEGGLRQEPEYADAHWHLAGILTELGRPAEACSHLRRFLTLAPQSPWAELARERLAASLHD